MLLISEGRRTLISLNPINNLELEVNMGQKGTFGPPGASFRASPTKKTTIFQTSPSVGSIISSGTLECRRIT